MPTTSAEWVAQGERHLASRQVAEAEACYERAAQLDPSQWTTWAMLGRLRMSMRRFDAAHEALVHACSLKPDSPEVLTSLAHVLREDNRAGAAIEACGRALALDPGNPHAAIAEALMLPPIYDSAEDLASWRRRFDAGLARLEQTTTQWLQNPRRILDLEWSNFLLAYQGENDVDLQTRYSRLVAILLGAAVPGLQAPLARKRYPSKLRIGFISSDFRRSTVGEYFLRWLTDLPRERFHVTVFYTGPVVDDVTQTIYESSDSFLQVTGTADLVARAVRATDLDIAVLPDVGMSAKSALLANLRLAPIQCAAWGHPVTTGSAFVDYFFSCATMEPPDGAAHYNETLMLLPEIGTRYAPYQDDASPTPTREQLGLPEDLNLYVCPQSLCKIHPENDELFIEIVTRDDKALIVFFAGQASGQTQAFAQRLEREVRRRAVPARRHFTFLPRTTRERFLAVMKTCDVMIDTLRWSGGNTTLDALSCALPVVTLEGRLMRARQSAAMLRILGVDELIAGDRDEYVEIAVRVAHDKSRRSSLSARIRDAVPRLFDRTEPIAALADALTQVASRPRKQ